MAMDFLTYHSPGDTEKRLFIWEELSEENQLMIGIRMQLQYPVILE